MIPYLIASLIIGFLIPYIARRFAKFMPATFAGAIVELFRLEKKHPLFRKTTQYHQFIWRSIVSSVILFATTYLAFNHFDKHGFGFVFSFISLLILMAEIDYRTFLLPDILTIPLLLLGIIAPNFGFGFISAYESSVGAAVGYFLPVIVSLLIVWKNKEAFGGGDIKLLSAVGAWLGIEGLLYVIITASILGLLYALIQKTKTLAFGPMIAIASIIIAFYLY